MDKGNVDLSLDTSGIDMLYSRIKQKYENVPKVEIQNEFQRIVLNATQNVDVENIAVSFDQLYLQAAARHYFQKSSPDENTRRIISNVPRKKINNPCIDDNTNNGPIFTCESSILHKASAPEDITDNCYRNSNQQSSKKKNNKILQKAKPSGGHKCKTTSPELSKLYLNIPKAKRISRSRQTEKNLALAFRNSFQNHTYCSSDTEESDSDFTFSTKKTERRQEKVANRLANFAKPSKYEKAPSLCSKSNPIENVSQKFSPSLSKTNLSSGLRMRLRETEIQKTVNDHNEKIPSCENSKLASSTYDSKPMSKLKAKKGAARNASGSHQLHNQVVSSTATSKFPETVNIDPSVTSPGSELDATNSLISPSHINPDLFQPYSSEESLPFNEDMVQTVFTPKNKRKRSFGRNDTKLDGKKHSGPSKKRLRSPKNPRANDEANGSISNSSMINSAMSQPASNSNSSHPRSTKASNSKSQRRNLSSIKAHQSPRHKNHKNESERPLNNINPLKTNTKVFKSKVSLAEPKPICQNPFNKLTSPNDSENVMSLTRSNLVRSESKTLPIRKSNRIAANRRHCVSSECCQNIPSCKKPKENKMNKNR